MDDLIPSANLALITAVDLQTHVLWQGKILAEWQKSKARMEPHTEYEADHYFVTLKYLGEEKVLKRVKVSGGGETFVELGGITTGRSYRVEVQCSFAERVFDCGSSSIFVEAPIFMTDSTVYAETINPDSWYNLEESCISSRGHLVSLTDRDLENSLAWFGSMSNYWCGGNICPDTPAPKDSLWSSGNPTRYTNFAYDSMLDGQHCCIKMDVVLELEEDDGNDNATQWKGENCQRIMQGICEFQVQPQLDSPANLTAIPVSSSAIQLTWNVTAHFWLPERFQVEFCHVRSLSSAALTLTGSTCNKEIVEGSIRNFTLHDLMSFSEYRISITGNSSIFEAASNSVQILARTREFYFIDWLNVKSHSC